MALFFARTVFIGYKYLFFATLVPCLLYSVYMLFKQGIARPKIKILLLPILVMALFFAHFSPFSNVVKESMNIAFIVYFIAFSNWYYADDKCDVFLKWIVRLTVFAGCLAIVRLALSIIGISLPLSSYLFEGEGFSLVRDNNFFSLFFIISILLSNELLLHKHIDKFEHLIINVVAVINIIANISRRAYVLYALGMVVMFVLFVLKKNDFKKTLMYNAAAVLIVAVCGGFVVFFANTKEMSPFFKYRFYKIYCSFIDNAATYGEFNIKQLRRYYERQEIETDKENLFYKGDLQNGLEAWNAQLSPHDCIRFGLVADECGDSVICVSRGCSGGYWQVNYKGRPIVYHKDVTYEISFAYRVLEGSTKPFCVGWWVDEGNGYEVDLPQIIEPIDSVWNRCSVSIKFKRDHINSRCFLNSLQAGSTIYVKNIRMTCDDTTGLPRYVDQLPDNIIHKYYSQDTINYFTAPRTIRWRYALELWQTRYTTKQKIFGQGFMYLEWYGEKFWNNPKRYDFPHNPIISSFLYSGIIGGVVYIIFLIMSLWLYWKKRKTMGIFFIMYLCCMFFSMFSGSSHFSFPLFAFLSFLPFVEYKNDNNSCEDLPVNG